jgi:hypothetical protein
MMKIGLALGGGILGFLAMLVLGCSGSDSPSFGNKTTGSGTGGTHSNSTGTSGTTGVSGGTMGSGGVGPSFAGGAGSTPVTCTPPTVVTATPTADLLTNLDMDTAVSGFSPGGGWFSYKDDEPSGMLTPVNTAFMTESPGANNSAAAVHVVGSGFMPDQLGANYGGGVGFSLASPQGTPGDLSGAAGISFYAKSGKPNEPSDIKVAVSTTATDPLFCICNATGCFNSHFIVIEKASGTWSKHTVLWNDLKQADWGYRTAFDNKTVLTINFVSNGPVPAFDFWVDEVSLVH